jgi:peroxiredoxin Q/BCP
LAVGNHEAFSNCSVSLAKLKALTHTTEVQMTAERLEEGSKAPAFTLENQDGEKVKLSEFKGQKVIVYFFPAASTPGCTKEACEFNENLNPLKAAGYTVVGISKDPIKKLKKFHEDQDLNFNLLSDESLDVHKLYGSYGEKMLYGRAYEGVLRSTFVIDEKGKVTLPLYNVKATGHVAMLRKQLGI